jgi:DNA-binding NarL/FixJ family response regulator
MLGATGTDNAKIRVLVVDDHDLFRAGLASVLAAQPDIEVVSQASGGKMAVRLARELRPDVVLMDLRMPDLGGSDATRSILQHDPNVRVLALTVSSDESDVATASSPVRPRSSSRSCHRASSRYYSS